MPMKAGNVSELRPEASKAGRRSHDSLLECLVIMARRFQRPVSADALVAGLPVKPGEVVPELFSIESSKGLFSRVAKRAGFATRLIQRDLDQFSDLLLPCILVLKDRDACVLDSIDTETGEATVILPDLSDGETVLSLEELGEQYLGFAFLVKPELQRKARQQQKLDVGAGHWFWGTLRRSRQIYLSVIIGSILVNIFALVTPLFTMNVYDRVVPNQALETLWVLAIGVGTVYVLDALMRFLRNYLLEIAGKKSDVIMSSIMFEQVMNMRMDKWPDSIGSFTSKLNQFESIRSFFTASTMVTLVDLPFSFIFLAVIAYVGDALVAIPLVTIGLLLLYSLILVRPLRNNIESVFAASSLKNSMLVESLANIETIKTLGASRYAQWAWEEASGEIARRSVGTRMLSGSISVVTNFLVQANMIGIVILGVYEIVDLNLSLGALIATVILASRAIAPMAQVAGLMTNYQQTKSAFTQLDALMKEEVERPEGENFVRRPTFDGSIEFRDVSFSYPDAETASLNGFNLNIKAGERVGIIGKSTSSRSIRQISGAASATCPRRSSWCGAPSARTSPSKIPASRIRRSSMRRRWLAWICSSIACLAALIPLSGSGARSCPVGSASAWLSREPFSWVSRSWSLMSRPTAWTTPPSRRFAVACSTTPVTRPWSSSPTRL
jgi:ATP-binding cassette subfamily C protein LapB